MYNNVMVSKRKRIGFLLASIHTGSSLNLWTSLIHDMSSFEDAFFVFPGGRLNVINDSEYLRNTIYPLANKENLDGLISWGSSIGSSVTSQELNRFHYNFSDIPYVTIAHKMPGRSCVQFDAYTGMAKLVKHFIEEHGCTKIAFLRGPAHHASASERYRAYCDVMQSCGIDFKKASLVTDPFGWSDGGGAVKQLYEDRKLEPGRDFEVLIGSSDMMTFSAVQYLLEKGYKVPFDFKCAGFNDSPESRILGSAFSTVHLPYTELALSALQMLTDQMSGKRKGENDITLDAGIIIRESCGCPFPADITSSSVQPSSFAHMNLKTESALVKALSDLLGLDETGTNSVIEPIIGLMHQNNIPLLFSLFEKALERFFMKDADIRLLYRALQLVRSSSFVPPRLFEQYENKILLTISLVQNRVHESRVYTERKLKDRLNSFKCDLLAARSRKDLLYIMHKHLRQLDIASAALVMYSKEGTSCFAGGFYPEGMYDEEQFFSSNLLLPKEIEGFDSGVFLVQSLFMEKEPIGYFICSVPPYDGLFFEELRSAISSALAGIFLFEEMAQAKRNAEAAEDAKSRFFANVGTDLLEPFEELSSLLNTMINSPGNESSTSDLYRNMQKLQTLVDIQREKTGFILDLTMSQTNDLKLSKTLLHIEPLLNPSCTDFSLPLIYADTERLSQALHLLANNFSLDPSCFAAEKTDNALRLSLKLPGTASNFTNTNNSMLLAESILLLHGAAIEQNDENIVILFPWPVFSCKNAESNAPVIEWDTSNSDTQKWALVYSGKDSLPFAQSAFLCRTDLTNHELSVIKNFTSMFEKKAASSVENPILFIGQKTARYPLWAQMERCIFIPSISELSQCLEKYNPSIIVLEEIDAASAEKIRNNPKTVMIPVFIVNDHIRDEDEIKKLLLIPRVIISNRYIAQSEEFASRVNALLSGDDILPADTGALVKKAILYLNKHAGTQISRWKLADFVHVSEDYLTRIFHKELGLSPWEYLSRYRIYLASQMLVHTNCTVYEAAEKCGFQDQAYFCRVFKKITGVPPGKYRANPENSH